MISKNKYIVILLYITLFQLYSCNKKKDIYSNYSEWILGEWNIGKWGFYFISKDSCEVRPGYLEESASRSPYRYFGNRTAYRISRDTLRIFDLSKNRWDVYKIGFSSPTTMIIYWGKDGCHQEVGNELWYWGENYPFHPVEYEKAQYAIGSENLFDQIVIHDPFYKNRTLSIDSSGVFLYSGHSYRDWDIRGLYTSNEGKRAFKQIELLFREANSIEKFIGIFPARIDSTFDRLVPTITFIKNNQMVTIAGPVWGTDVVYREYYQEYFLKEFRWAYEQSLYLEQQMPVKPFIKPDHWSRDYLEYDGYSKPFVYFINNSDKKYLWGLYDSEDFYLWTQILKAKQVTDVDFTPKYTVNNHVQSDGRYYRYKTERGDTIILDLGFNFIEKNNLAK